ncbi:MAG: hypothetical protein WDN46_06860 [Methylocella sp.]
MSISEPSSLALRPQTSLHCSYHDGMFSHEPRWESRGGKSDGFLRALEHSYEIEATCFHEAGHAVIDYALGMGCASVSIEANYAIQADGKLGVRYGGLAMPSARMAQKSGRQIKRNVWNEAILIFGVVNCAGPAAERKFRFLHDMPQRLLFASEGDHSNVDAAGKRLEMSGRCSFAYRRLTWRVAQRYLDQEAVWGAIEVLADELNLEWSRVDPDGTEEQPKAGDQIKAVVDGRRARTLMRRAGVRPGMLGIMFG